MDTFNALESRHSYLLPIARGAMSVAERKVL